jgi:DNA-binding Xre family transcriptional regulator
MPDVLPVVRMPEVVLNIQIEKLLKQYYRGKIWGVNEQIRKRTGLSLAKIRSLRKNTAKSISLETLEKICAFLITECHIPPEELFGKLFGIAPAEFWTMFRSVTSSFFQVQICQGVRNDPKIAEPRWINAYDAYLSATFIRHLMASDSQRQPDVEQCLCRSYVDERHAKEISAEAKRLHKRFRDDSGSRALVCIGSVKSLPVSECVLAELFGTEPFIPRDKGRRLHNRSIPVFFRYRENDPTIPSALGGREFRLPAADGRAGIAYEVDEKHWQFCPISETEDAALIFYVNRPPEETVELVLAGFSGRATGAIAMGLSDLVSQFWPPSFIQPHLMVGAFIVRYEFAPPSSRQLEQHPILVEPSNVEVIPLSGDVLARRLTGVDATLEPTGTSKRTRRGPGKPRPR